MVEEVTIRKRYPWWLRWLILRNRIWIPLIGIRWWVKGMRWWPAMVLNWITQGVLWLVVAALVVRADTVDVGLAAFGRLRYLCTLDPLDAEYHLARAEATRRYMRRLSEIDIELGKARARCAWF